MYTSSKIIIGAIVATVLLAACSQKKEETKTAEAQEITAVAHSAITYPVALDQSSIYWEGRKVGTGSKHVGTIALKSGEVAFDTDSMKLKGGDFIVDMNSMNNLDLKGEMKAKLEEHLKSADFFDVEKYPEVRFQIVSADELTADGHYRVVGNLTMKETTNSIEFDVEITCDAATGTLSAESDEIVIDRTKWGVSYGSKNIFKDLKDNIIDDQISIKLHIVAKV